MGQVKVSGKITLSGSGEPLPGVTIREQGTNNGTLTGNDGSYAIEVASNEAILIFTYLGFTTVEMPVNGQAAINISMEEAVADLFREV